MEENGELSQMHVGKCMKVFQEERKMQENGRKMVGKWDILRHLPHSSYFSIF